MRYVRKLVLAGTFGATLNWNTEKITYMAATPGNSNKMWRLVCASKAKPWKSGS